MVNGLATARTLGKPTQIETGMEYGLVGLMHHVLRHERRIKKASTISKI